MCICEHVNEQLVGQVIGVLRTVFGSNMACHMVNYKPTNWTPSDGMVVDVWNPTCALQMAESKCPHLADCAQNLVLKSRNQQLVSKNPEFHKIQNLSVEVSLPFLTGVRPLDVFDGLRYDSSRVYPVNERFKDFGFHILENVGLRFSFLKATVESRI